VQDLPAAVLGMHIEERLDRLAVRRPADLAEKTHGLLEPSKPFPHLDAIGRDRVRLRHNLLLLDHVLQDKHDLVGRRAMQVGAAAELCDLLGRLGGFRVHRRKACRDNKAFSLLGAALQRLDAGRRGETDRGDLILRVGRPVLVVPPNIESISGRNVVIAWKDTREARRAVQDALPLLRLAEKIIIAEICESSADIPLSEARLGDVSSYLARHRMTATVSGRVKPVDRMIASSLLGLAREESADLVVAGAYGHSRLGEWVFGGMTRDLLSESPICCLFSH
jgi:nucleotide-binding universal stress UspA family protein